MSNIAHIMDNVVVSVAPKKNSAMVAVRDLAEEDDILHNFQFKQGEFYFK